MTRRQYTGGAITASLASSINGVDTTISCTSLSGWPTGSVGGFGPFFIVIGRGTASEEKILCSSRSGDVLTVASGGRGADGTPATSHSVGAVAEHVFTATDADEANYHVNTSASTASIAIHGLLNGSAVVGTTDTQLLTNKTATTPATSDNTTKIATTAYVKSQATATTPIVDGTAAVGTLASGFALGNHVHPLSQILDLKGIESGTATVAVSASDRGTVVVSFSNTYTSAPFVMMVTRGTQATAGIWNAFINSLSASQVTIGVRNVDGSTYTGNVDVQYVVFGTES